MRRVLLVEDNPNNRRILQLMLRHLGIEPVLAVDGEQAVQAFAEQPFDLILMDLQMPHMDGLQASRLIREIEFAKGRPHTPIMAVTANALPEDRAACTSAGMDDFIAKPVHREPFLNRVDHWLHMDKPEATCATSAPKSADDGVNDAFDADVYDMTVLKRLGHDVGEELIPELLAGFAEDLQQHLDSIPRLRESADSATLTRVAHSLKSSAATFGANELSDAARTVETHGREGASDDMYAALPHLVAEMQKALLHMPR